MDHSTFNNKKKKLVLTDRGLYQPRNPFSDQRGIVTVDRDISELVLNLNSLPFVVTGPSCQGHFLYSPWVDDKPYKVDFAESGSLVFASNGREVKPLNGFRQLVLQYSTFPNVTIGINQEDERSREFNSTLENLVRLSEGKCTVDETDWKVIRFVPKDVSENKDREYSLDEARTINRIRLEGISGLQKLVLPFVERYSVEPVNWEELIAKSKEGIKILRRTGRIAPEVVAQRNTDPIRYECKTKPIELPIAIHPSDKGRIIVHIPGGWERVNGYGNKYITLANFMRDQGLAAVVRMDNTERDYHPLEETLFDDLRFVIDYVLQNAEQICGSSKPEVYLMSFSGGGHASGVVAHEYDIPKMLMMAPAIECDSVDLLREGMAKFKGDLFLVQGEQDFVVRCNGSGGKVYYNMATDARSRNLIMIPDCDHFFKHEVNDRIYSRAPFWAFGGDTTFPDYANGIRLVQK